MKYGWMLVVCLMAGSASAGETFRFDRGVVVVGDATGALVQRAGDPSRVTPIENKYGAKIGERWEYYQRNKTVAFIIENGKVTKIEEIR